MSMKIMLVGGGSGGHLTPLIPVADALKKQDASIQIIAVGQKGDPMNSILDSCASIDKRAFIQAGKYRRYHGESLIRRLSDFKTFAWNVRDLFRFIFGIVQAWKLLGKERPNVIFMKGGYVGAPIGIVASWRHIPYLTHDSDAMISLAHRIIAKHASLHLTAYEPRYYPRYDQAKTVCVGLPIRESFKNVDVAAKKEARDQLGIENTSRVVFVVGGGLGARSVNEAIVANAQHILQKKNVQLFHVTGQKLYDETKTAYAQTLSESQQEQLHLFDFLNDIHVYNAAADVVVTRAGATNMAEFALQGKACIMVPNPALSGGHQLLNARAFEEKHAVVRVNEKDAQAVIGTTITRLLDDDSERRELEQSIRAFASPQAAEMIAEKIIACASKE